MKKNLLIISVLFISQSSFSQITNSWQRVISDTLNAGEYFGTSVHIDSNYAFVGAPKDLWYYPSKGYKDFRGGVSVFNKTSSSNWQFSQAIYPSDTSAYFNFGRCIASSGEYLAVGAVSENGFGPNWIHKTSAVYIFKRDPSGVYHETQIIATPNNDLFDYFGYSLGLSGDKLLIGAPGNSTDLNDQNYIQYTGAAFYYKKNANGVFSLEQKILSPFRSELGNYGLSLDVSGNTLAISGSEWAGVNTIYGYYGNVTPANVYSFNALTGNWVFQDTLTASGLGGYAYGSRVSVDGNICVVSNPLKNNVGEVAVFRKKPTNEWELENLISGLPVTNVSFFGMALSLSNNKLLVGNYSDDFSATKTYVGSAYLYEMDNVLSNWNLIDTLFADTTASGDQFGYSIDLAKDMYIVGARNKKVNGIGTAGAAYFFKVDTPVVNTSVDYYDRSAQIQLFPIPFTNSIGFKASFDLKNSQVQIIDMSGKLVLEEKLSNSNSVQLPFLLSPGSYIINLYQDNRLMLKRKITNMH